MTQEKAQERMYEITAERIRLQEKVDRVNNYIDEILDEGRGLLEQYPCLLFHRPEKS